MPLNLTDFNQFYVINKICGQEKQRHYLESLGFVPGARISILSELHGYYLVMVKGSKIGLDKSWLLYTSFPLIRKQADGKMFHF